MKRVFLEGYNCITVEILDRVPLRNYKGYYQGVV